MTAQFVDPIVLVTGGTGGHVFPAEAVAGELARRNLPLALCTDERGRAWAADRATEWTKQSGRRAPVPIHVIRAGRVTGVGKAARLRGMADMAFGMLQARRTLRHLSPSVVVGFGGYASVPAMMAAISLGLPTVIHEQNALLGRANRLLAPRASAIATAFETVERLPSRLSARVVHTGNPVRDAVRRLRDLPYAAPSGDERLNLLVTGGSQGASVFARILPDGLSRLPESLRARIDLVQQCRAEDLTQVRTAYESMGMAAELAPFFPDLPERLARAHLVVCRSGASTVAELTCAGRPAILVPYPHAADDHQTANARAVSGNGGAVMLRESDFTGEALAERLSAFLREPAALETMARAARAGGHRRAAGNLAILVAGLAADRNAGTPATKGRIAA